jgi:hypothetical protein
MDSKVENKVEFKCNICVKTYSSYKSLWNHNKNFHNNNVSIISPNVSKSVNSVSKNTPNVSNTLSKVICKWCNKKYSSTQNRWKHEQKCKNKENNKDKIKQLEATINELKAQVQSILNEKGKIHHKTLQKINNQLTNNINNGNIMNNTYVKFGDLDYERILNSKQVKNILHKQFKCLEESIKQVHFNEQLPEYNNVFITNMKDDIAYVFNGKQFISVRKNEMLNELIDVHVNEINLSLEKNKNKINEYYVNKIEEFLNKLNDDSTKFTDHNNNRTYNNYKAYKINSIKLLIYNESDKKKLELLNGMELHEKTYDEPDDDSDSLVI